MNRMGWAGIIAGVALASAAASGAGTYAFTRHDSATPEPDIVVGVILECDYIGIPSGAKLFATTGTDCDDNNSKTAAVVNRRQTVTVRRGNGGATYSAVVSSATNVHMGDAWPPK